jgi:hypothetical protein
MDAAYFQAAIPEPYRIFGLRLLPLSLGRYRLLARFGCGFVADGEVQATMEDLLLGVLICSMRVKQFMEFIESPEAVSELKPWGELVRKQIAQEEYFSLYAKIGLFRAYIDEASHVPQYWEETPEESASGAHWAQSLEVVLRGQLNYTEEEIEEGPLSKALSDCFKLAESQGQIRIMGEEDLAGGAANAAALVQMLGGKGAAPCPA